MRIVIGIFAALVATSPTCNAADSDALKANQVTPWAVKSTSATREINVDQEIKLFSIRKNEEAAAIIEGELNKEKPFSQGIPKTLRSSSLQALATPLDATSTWDLRDPWRAWCSSDWDQRCEGFEEWNPPNGWDICRFNVVEETKNHGEWAVVAADAKKVRVHLKSWGSRFPLDRWGGSVAVRLATVQLISASATPEQRSTLGCSYSNGGGRGSQGMSEVLFCAADPADPNGSVGVQMCADYIFENGQKKYIRGPYPCGICYRK